MIRRALAGAALATLVLTAPVAASLATPEPTLPPISDPIRPTEPEAVPSSVPLVVIAGSSLLGALALACRRR